MKEWIAQADPPKEARTVKKINGHSLLLSSNKMIHCGVVVITTAQLYSTKPELRFCAGSNPACGVSEIQDGEDL